MSNDSIDSYEDDTPPVADVYPSPWAAAESRLNIHSRRLGKLREFQLTTEGINGKNGRIGILTGRLDGLAKLAVAVIVALIGSLGGVVGVAWKSAAETGRRDAVIEQLKAEVATQGIVIESMRATLFSYFFKTGTPP